MTARNKLARRLAAGALLLGSPAFAASGSRQPASSGRFPARYYTAEHAADTESQPARTAPELDSPFDAFGSTPVGAENPPGPDARVEAVLAFLHDNDLLRTDVTHASTVSGDLHAVEGRKRFAHASAYSHCHSGHGTWNTASWPSSSEGRCVNTYGGTWHTKETAPLVETVTVSNKTSTSFDVNVDINQSSTAYIVLLESSRPAPSSAQVKAGTDGDGVVALQADSLVLNSGDFSGSFSFSGLDASNYYIAYVVGDSGAETTPTPASVTNAFDTGTISSLDTWKFPKVRVDSAGNFYVAHEENGNIIFKRWNGSSFVSQTSFNAADIPGRSNMGWGNEQRVDFELDSSGNIHVVFSASTSNMAADNDAFYGYHDGSSWSFTQIGETGYIDEVNVYLDAGDHVHVSFKNRDLSNNNAVGYATNVSGSWTWSTVATATSDGADEIHDTYVVVESDGDAHIFYRREDNQNNAEDNYYHTTSTDGFSTQTLILNGKGNQKLYRLAGVHIDESDKIHYAYANQTDAHSYYVEDAFGTPVSREITHAGHGTVLVDAMERVGSTFYFTNREGATNFLSAWDGSQFVDGVDFTLVGWMNDRFAVSETVDRIVIVSEYDNPWEIYYHTSTIDGYVLGVGSGSSNAAPTDISLNPASPSVGQSAGTNATAGTLSTTDADGGDSHSYRLVAGTGDDDNTSFNISGNSLRVDDASALAPGNYSVRIETDDNNGGTFQEAFSVAIVDDIAPAFENGAPSISATYVSGAAFSVDLNEDGTVYYVVVADGAAAPDAAQVEAGLNGDGAAATAAGSFATTATTGGDSFSGMNPGTAYDLYVVAEDGAGNLQASPNLVNFTTLAADGDGNLTQASTVTEPVDLPTTALTPASAVNVFDFRLTDGGAGDGLPMIVSQIRVNAAGTSSDAERGRITWRLNGPDANQVIGVYDTDTDTITFSGLSVSVADGGSEVYAVNAYYNDPANLSDGHTVTLGIDGDNDVTVDSAGTTMGATSIVDNGTGTAIAVTATRLAFTTQPAGSISGSALTTQPVLTAQDAHGNTDVHFSETVTLTEASAGTLSGAAQVSAVGGMATFTDLAYAATADQQSFTLTANDQDGVGTDLSTVDANAVTADVVATQLRFATQPAPASIDDGATTAFTTVPVLEAVDDEGVVDTGYATDMVLGVTDPDDSVLDGTLNSFTGTGDSDGSGSTVTRAPAAGTSTFTGLTINYSNQSAIETLVLRAASGGLAAVDSVAISSAKRPTVTDASIQISGGSGTAGAFRIGDTATVTWDDTGAGDGNGGITGVTVDFSELGGGSAINANNAGDMWTASYTIPAGTLEATNLNVSVTAVNAAGSTTTLDTSNVTVDNRAPGVSLGSDEDGAVSGPFTLNVSFDEAVAAFTVADITAGNATLADFAGSGQSYSVTVAPVTDGTVTVDVAADAAEDGAGNGSGAAQPFSIDYDGSGPQLTSSTPADGATGVAYDTGLVLAFDETINAGTGAIRLFDAADDAVVETVAAGSGQVTVNGSQAEVAFAGTLTPTHSYYVTVDAGVVQDALANPFDGISTGEAIHFTVANNAPVAQADAATTAEDESVDVAVLDNDSDTESVLNAASVTVVTPPSHGKTSVNTGTGVITYTPDADHNGADSFAYTVDDLHGGTSAPATVAMTINAVNDPPDAKGEMVSSDEDSDVLVDVAANDADRDVGDAVDPATLSITTAPIHGTAAVESGSIRYTPDPDYHGSDELRYTIADGNGAVSDAAKVVINVAGVNDAPVAGDDTATIDEDTSANIAVTGNDSDIDGTVDVATVEILNEPGNGNATVDAATGVVSYLPAEDFHGEDTFTYVVKDGEGASSNEATVIVTVTSVNDAPRVNADEATLEEEVTHNINVLGNDEDVDGTLDATSVEVVEAPASGTVQVDTTSGSIAYTPAEDFYGDDELTYRVSDDAGAWSEPVPVRLTVQPINDAPLANDDTASTSEDASVDIDVLANDSDVDGSLDVNGLTVQTTAQLGDVTVLVDGSLRYTPHPDASGSDSFSYTIADDAGATSNIATVSVAIEPVNDAPVIGGTPAPTAVAGQPYTFTPSLEDVDSATLTLEVANLPGWATFDPATGRISGTPSNANTGRYTGIVLTASDGTDSSSLPAFDIRVMRDTDLDGLPDRQDHDSDGDGIPNKFESQNGLDPLDAGDAGEDTDEDGVDNLAEYLAGSDLYHDDQPPAFGIADMVAVNATALLTPRPELIPPAAVDARDGSVDVTLADSQVRYAPGTHQLVWHAEDASGNPASVVQRLDVLPQISLTRDQMRAEGATAQVRFVLNGYAPSYPFTVDYTVSGTADEDDHDLADGSVTFLGGELEKAVTVEIFRDAVGEGRETIRVDLAGDGNFGTRDSHVITIVEDNEAPSLEVTVTQGDQEAMILAQDGGPATFRAVVDDPNPQDEHDFEWQFPNGAQMTTVSPAERVLDPRSLAPGVYQVAVQIWDDGSPYMTTRDTLSIRVVAARPALSPGEDQDGDGISDASEGAGDEDQDGQPDYLDAVALPNVINERTSDRDHYMVEADPGLKLTLGAMALGHGSDGAELNDEEMRQEGVGADEVPNVGGYFDFRVRNLPIPGASVNVVIPQREAIPEGAIYRKLAGGVWFTFIEDTRNGLASAPGEQGVCPPPGDSAYTPGLAAGHWCVKLFIEDGGPNDADGLANGTVDDPGGVGAPEPIRHETRGGGGGGAMGGPALLGLLALVLWRQRHRLRRLPLAAMLLATVMVAPVDVRASEAYPAWSNVYVSGSVGRAESGIDRDDLQQALDETDGSINVVSVDDSSAAWSLSLGYQIGQRWAVEAGYLDLGRRDVVFTAHTTQADLADVHPEASQGVSLSGVYAYPIRERFDVHARLGLYRWRQDYRTRTAGGIQNTSHDHGTDVLWGFGAGYQPSSRWRLNAEYRRFEVAGEHTGFVSLGVSWWARN